MAYFTEMQVQLARLKTSWETLPKVELSDGVTPRAPMTIVAASKLTSAP